MNIDPHFGLNKKELTIVGGVILITGILIIGIILFTTFSNKAVSESESTPAVTKNEIEVNQGAVNQIEAPTHTSAIQQPIFVHTQQLSCSFETCSLIAVLTKTNRFTHTSTLIDAKVSTIMSLIEIGNTNIIQSIVILREGTVLTDTQISSIKKDIVLKSRGVIKLNDIQFR